MIKEIKMPSAGQTTDQATICEWKVKKGDSVKRGDILLEVETDKATLPVESFANGLVIDLLVEEGDTVDAGDVLCVIGDQADMDSYSASGETKEEKAEVVEAASEDEEDEYRPIIKGAKVPKVEVKKEEKPVVVEAPVNREVKAMPNAKRLAKLNNVDLSKVVSANGGLIKASDVQKYIDSQTVDASAYEVVKMSRMRTIIGQRMLESVQNIPSFTISVDIDMTNAVKLKNDIFARKAVKISYNDIIAMAISRVAKEFTLLNARYENNELRIYKHTNIGIAVGLDGALVVPVTKAVDQMGLLEIASVNKENIKKARDGKLLPTDMGCGSLSISNLGMFEVNSFTAIVNPPESCIFAVAKIETKPVFINNTFVPRQMSTITVSFDHRIIDGSYGAKMLNSFKALMENPALLLVE